MVGNVRPKYHLSVSSSFYKCLKLKLHNSKQVETDVGRLVKMELGPSSIESSAFTKHVGYPLTRSLYQGTNLDVSTRL